MMDTFLRRFHLSAGFIWILLSYPGIVHWRDSILFVIICSLWANIAGEFGAYQAARAEKAMKNDNSTCESCSRNEEAKA